MVYLGYILIVKLKLIEKELYLKLIRFCVVIIFIGNIYFGCVFLWKYDWIKVYLIEFYRMYLMLIKEKILLLLYLDKSFFVFGFEVERIYILKFEKSNLDLDLDLDLEDEEKLIKENNCVELYYFSSFNFINNVSIFS